MTPSTTRLAMPLDAIRSTRLSAGTSFDVLTEESNEGVSLRRCVRRCKPPKAETAATMRAEHAPTEGRICLV